jgi:hypothetical protein
VNEERIPDAVSNFINRYVESIEYLEILLALFESPRSLSSEEILQKIQSSKASVDFRLSQLQTGRLILKEDDHYKFAPADESLQSVVADLAICYRRMRVRIIEAIYSRKTDAIQTFADAFKFRKEE